MHLRRTTLIAATVLAWLLLQAPNASAWMREPFEDADVVARSELIVVGRIKDGSIEYVPHQRKPGEGGSWEHHAILLVDDVLKGNVKLKDFPIVIHYGLDPTVGGKPLREQAGNPKQQKDRKPDGPIRLSDTGGMDGEVPVADLREKNLWFLRRRSGIFGREPGEGDFGIVDPEDVAPLSLREYFACYLAADPEGAVRRYLARDPQVAARAIRYLHHREVERIRQVADPAARIERLLPYYSAQITWGMHDEAREAIVAAGEAAGPYIMGLYTEARESNRRQDCIAMLGQIRYRPIVLALIELLESNDRYWAAEQPRLQKGWWNDNTDPRTQRFRQDRYGEVYRAVISLGQMADPRAKDAIEQTRRRWAAIQFENPQIVEECDAALKQIREHPASQPATAK